ncbi:DUF4136 domain-containing protein [Coraliomargarita sp. SDUM461004]|uniref:DUF4136 domain-containing protein n=1 Tax=Thalassobacterium sedimentorum TaxID=3041258 RepID=A0ABU1AKA8_9BACT|nr:DUF4136 domain-containing protein [Coraliomargarita sp. SDUM461004]MDQ8194275.1 DUF4136 domain-containing protein [Coraliomargarita sp. SDUM461004]
MKLFLYMMPLLAIITGFTGCMSTAQHAEFVKTINFSSLDTFRFKHTLVSGMDFRESDELLLEALSEQVIVNELQNRGFEFSDTDADFFAIVKWKKSVSSHVDPFAHIDPYTEVMARRDDTRTRFASRLHLTLEIYETRTQNLFWRKDLPNSFDALQLTEERVVASLARAIENFPQHIVKDPNLPSIE